LELFHSFVKKLPSLTHTALIASDAGSVYVFYFGCYKDHIKLGL